MRHLTTCLFAILFVSCLHAQESNPYPEEKETLYARLKVKSVRESGGEDDSWYIREYDRNGKLKAFMHETIFGDEGDTTRIEYEYNDDGNLVLETKFDEGRELHTRYVYEDTLLVRAYREYFIDFLSIDSTHYFYDENKRLTMEVGCDVITEGLFDTIRYKYDAKGRQIEMLESDFKTTFTYTDDGQLVGKKLQELGERVVGDVEEKYEYHGNGRKEKMVASTSYGGQKNFWAYDGKKRLTLEVKMYDMGGLRHQFGYWYDDNGLLWKRTWDRSTDPAYASMVKNGEYVTLFEYEFYDN